MLDNFEFSKTKSASDLYLKVSKAMGITDDNLYFDRKSQMTEE